MLVPMTQLEVLGQRRHLDDVLIRLQRLRAVEVAPTVTALDPPGRSEPSQQIDSEPQDPDELADPAAGLLALATRVERLLDLAAPPDDSAQLPPHGAGEPDAADLVELTDALEKATREAVQRREHLRAEADALPRTLESLAALLPLVPELAALSDAELAEIHLATIALVLDDPEGRVVAELADQLAEALGRRHLLVTAPVGDTVSALLVLPAADIPEVEDLLGRDRIARVTVPGAYAHRSLFSTVTAMRERLAALPGLIARAEADLHDLLAPQVPALRQARGVLAARLERAEAAQLTHTGPRTFALRVWTPRSRVSAVRDSIVAAGTPVVVTEVRARHRTGTAPVLLRNWAIFRPFERLVGFLSWPAHGALDPTGLMAVVLPLLFGIMVGDIGYGVLLVAIAWGVRRRWGTVSSAAGDISRVLGAGGWWSIVFGVLFGELFGDLGRYAFGMPALWFYRGGPDALMPLLLFVLAVGVAHIVLGLLLGLWTAVAERHPGHAAEKLGTLLVLAGLFALAGAAVSVLPGGVVTPAVAVVVVGIVLASVVHGALGALLGPLELIGTLGNILSYLRLAAVGLASVYLAVVASELARQAPLVLGVVIAVFFHALNLALAAFSPMIQALRLHYVEFFGRFYDGGGRPFAPLGAALPEAALPEAATVRAGASSPVPTEADTAPPDTRRALPTRTLTRSIHHSPGGN